MLIRYVRPLAALALVFTLLGCTQEAPEGPPPADTSSGAMEAPKSSDELLAEWTGLAQVQVSHEPSARALAVTGQLAAMGPESLMPLIDVLGHPESGPAQKVFVVQCLAPYVSGVHLERLAKIVGTSKDPTTRSCATALLARIGGRGAAIVLGTLVDDSEKRVRLAALAGLGRGGDAGARGRLVALYNSEDTNAFERLQILTVFLAEPGEEGVPLLTDAVKRPLMDPAVRLDAALALGRVGDASAISVLEKSKETAANDAYAEVADSAIAAIRERTEEEEQVSGD